MLKALSERSKGAGIIFTWTPEAAEIIANKGYDPVYGARPLRRMIVSLVEDKLSEKIISGELKKDSKIELYADNGELKFRNSED